ncbi:MAG: hypothetical protein A3J93_01905 [Candidatus Magasanikbacteria bacterium RIFOXYC2_FULL_42_28]|uniref:Uncharacterized protein n=1 Tax=Candidatus Magasanikbacteria bacterium RIFOXYC2_FULL_42_28 TaxID=1798704 RepID=A0A1F6NYM2_9BACT|nr:MAG: hypothetical protein A3J93_01905 [Candidatus Magasanikbacteria bacterium RIFOXYC2_FULL_42_28]
MISYILTGYLFIPFLWKNSSGIAQYWLILGLRKNGLTGKIKKQKYELERTTLFMHQQTVRPLSLAGFVFPRRRAVGDFWDGLVVWGGFISGF